MPRSFGSDWNRKRWKPKTLRRNGYNFLLKSLCQLKLWAVVLNIYVWKHLVWKYIFQNILNCITDQVYFPKYFKLHYRSILANNNLQGTYLPWNSLDFSYLLIIMSQNVSKNYKRSLFSSQIKFGKIIEIIYTFNI